MEFVSQHPILVVSVVKIVVLLFVTLTSLAYLTWFERKVVAHIQSRLGPLYTGPHGLLQPLADGLKFMFKEDLTRPGTDRVVYILAPILSLSLAITGLALIPFGPGKIRIFGQETALVIAPMNLGLLFLFAITAVEVYGVALAGWSSNSKYSLLGSLRSSAQMISYEVALTLSVVGVLLMAGSFDFKSIIESQGGRWLGFIPRWNVFPQILGFLCYFIAAIAETNRAPFDLAEAESELVAGFHTEYSSFKFAMFFMAEYAGMIVVSCLAAILFFGGWLSPLPHSWTWQLYIPTAILVLGGLGTIVDGLWKLRGLARFVFPVLGVVMIAVGALCTLPSVIGVVQGPFWFLLKVFLALFFYVWARSTLPRFRYDQLMDFGWKVLLPVSLANLVITAVVILVVHP